MTIWIDPLLTAGILVHELTGPGRRLSRVRELRDHLELLPELWFPRLATTTSFVHEQPVRREVVSVLEVEANVDWVGTAAEWRR